MGDEAELELEAIEELEDKIEPRLAANHNERRTIVARGIRHFTSVFLPTAFLTCFVQTEIIRHCNSAWTRFVKQREEN